MAKRGTIKPEADHHSDLGPSSKDWQPGSAGRDEDFTPDKDLWTAAHKGDLGGGRPDEDVHDESAASAERQGTRGGIQPGTHHEGRSWQSRRPESGNQDDKLDQALKDSFPASDPPQPAQPGITGWDLGETDRAYDGRSGRGDEGDWTRSRHSLKTTRPGLLWAAAALALLPVLISAAYYLRQSRGDRPRRDEWSADRRPPRSWET